MPRGRRFWTGGWGWFASPYGYQYWGRCRLFPWLPRWWWTGSYGANYPYSIPRVGETTMLNEQIAVLEQELVNIRRRLEQLTRSGV
jgi:hypothetical protein